VGALVWLVVGLIFIGAEVLSGDLILLMLAGGALSAAAVSAIFDTPLWVDGIVFAVVSLLLVFAVRPVAKRHMYNRPRLATNTEGLIGQHGVVVAAIDADSGQVKFGGGVWSARAAHPGDRFAEGESVTILEIDGATAVVWKG
jgi:membrane protein implicated in regulation of membrane protease activity